MKNFKFILYVLLLTLTCCKQDSNMPNNTGEVHALSVSGFQKLLDEKLDRFDGKRLVLAEKSSNQAHNFSSVGEIAWEINKSYLLNGFQVIEVPYLMTKGNLNLYSFRRRFVEDNEEDKKLRVAYSYSNIVYYKQNNVEAENILIVTYIPESGAVSDLKYFKTGERMSLNSIDKFFTGYVEYKSLKGSVLSIEYYEAGKITGRYSISKNNARSMNSSSQTCTTVCTPIYGMVCVSVPEHTEGETCTQQVVGQNCTQVCNDDDPDPEIPTPGGGGSPNPTYPIAQTQAMINEIFEPCSNFQVGSENYQIFLAEVQQLMDGSSGAPYACFTQKMMSFLAANSSSEKITLCLDVNKHIASYDAGTKALIFNDPSYIDYRLIFHEIIHACQDKIYPGGIGQYGDDPGKTEIEFETHLLIDIVGRILGMDPIANHDPTYVTFLNGLTTDNSGNRNLYNAKMYFDGIDVGQSSSYLQYKNAFKQKFDNYATSDFNLAPLTIKYFLNDFDCFL